MEGDKHNGIRACLDKLDTSNCDLSYSQLISADMNYLFHRGAGLRGSDLENSSLRGSDLSKADLVETNFQNANLRKADLQSAYLGRTILDQADLRHANLQNADLCRSSLTSADLSNANLSFVDLSFANLSHADLSWANLSGADLSNCIFDNTTFKNANLSGVRLFRTTVTHCNFQGTRFKNASFSNCNFLGTDFSGGIGLDETRHLSPSKIDIESLRSSRNKIPISFLEGCGLLDWEIENAKLYQDELLPSQLTDIVYKIHDLRSSKPILYFSVFISYSHSDKTFAVKLHDALQKRGIRCWLDEHQMLPGDDIYEQIDRGIKNWDKLLLCCSESSLSEKWWVDLEINKAFEKERSIMRKRRRKVLAMIPLDLDGYLFSDDYLDPKRDEITSRVAAQFSGWENDKQLFNDSIDKVIKLYEQTLLRENHPLLPLFRINQRLIQKGSTAENLTKSRIRTFS